MTAIFTTSDNNFGVAKWIVNQIPGQGTHTTIASAIASASSGENIFIYPGIYIENLVLKNEVNLVGFTGDGDGPHVSISGKCSFSATGLVTINNIFIQNFGDFALEVSGTFASILTINNCSISVTGALVGISNTSTNSNASINVKNSRLNITNVAAALHNSTSPGSINYSICNIGNSALSPVISNNSSGFVNLSNCYSESRFSTTSVGAFTCGHSVAAINNASFFSSTGTGSAIIEYLTARTGNFSNISIGLGCSADINFCKLVSGSASGIIVGGNVTAYNNFLDNSNINPITGGGTLSYGGNIFDGLSLDVNVATQFPKSLSIPQGGTEFINASWTPTLQFGGSSTGITYSTRTGEYSKICNVVYFTFRIVLTSKGSATGTAFISGLPLAATSTTMCAVRSEQLTFSAFITGEISGSGDVFLVSSTSGGVGLQLDDTNFSNTTTLIVSGFYFTS